MFRLCGGAEYLLQIVHGAIPIEGDTPLSSAETAVHILNHLYEKLNDACLVQGGEVVALYWSFDTQFLLLVLIKKAIHFAAIYRKIHTGCYSISLLDVYCHILRFLIPGFLREY